MTNYTCVRCGYTARQKSHYRDHIIRQRICKPKKSEEMPSMDNVIVTEKIRKPKASATNVTNNNYNNTTNNTTNNNDHSTTNNTDNSVHITNHIHYSFGSEDLSLITKGLIQQMITQGDKDEEYYSRNVEHFVRNIHFNPLLPHNMTTFTDRSKNDIYNTDVFNGERWVKYQKTAAVARTMQINIATKMLDIMRTLDSNDVNKDKLDDWIDYLSNVSEDDDLVQDLVSNVMDPLSHFIVAHHPDVIKNR